jgi:hypothetical protein
VDSLVSKFRSLLATWDVPYKRYLFDKINWSARAILPPSDPGQDTFVVSDNLEIGSANRIPLWLFGFLY